MIIYFQLQESKKTKWFDVQTKKWSNGPEMNKGRYEHGCVKIPQTSQRKSQILVVGGDFDDWTIESLENSPTTRIWLLCWLVCGIVTQPCPDRALFMSGPFDHFFE